VLAFALVSSPGAAQDTASFVRTGDMTVSRSQHTATLLPDGKVLITGGVTHTTGDYGGRVLASAELYDPATGAFTATGSMSAARRMHTATLLPDGRVLIVGGYEDSYPIRTAELFDPATGTFSAVGGMRNGRGGHDAILLNNGTVLIVGGFDGRYPLIPTAEIYDPGTGTFTAVGPYAQASCDFCPPSILLADGKVLFTLQQPAQLFDPLTASFSATGRSNGAESAATLLMNGRVLFNGGEDWGRSKSAELYDPLTGTFAATGDMTQPRVWHTLTLLPDGTVLTTGGETDECGANYCIFAGTTRTAELYDPATASFSTTSTMGASRGGHTATLLNDGRVLMTGGVGYGGIGVFYGSAGTAELYTPPTLIPTPTLLSSSEESDEGLILHAGSGNLVSAENPAIAGDTLEIRFTGLHGESVIAPRVMIGGRLTEVLSFTARPDSSGVSAVLIRMPTGIEPGPAVAVRLSYIGRTSNQVTLVVAQPAGANRVIPPKR
jgi:hypothetical protein